jgi:hypothetical protein
VDPLQGITGLDGLFAEPDAGSFFAGASSAGRSLSPSKDNTGGEGLGGGVAPGPHRVASTDPPLPGRSAPPAGPVPGPQGASPHRPATGSNFTKGSYSLWDINTSLTKATFGRGIVGVTISVSWSSVQTGTATYTWTTVDTRISEATTAGLKVALVLDTSAVSTPSFVLSNPLVQQVSMMDTNSNDSTYGQNVTGPVFWDATALGLKDGFITAAGLRYASNPTVVAVGYNFASWYSCDWSVPTYVGNFTPPGGKTINLNQVQQWLTAGYTTTLMLTTGETMVDTTALAFPTQTVKLAIGQTDPGLDGTSSTLAADILSYAYTNHASFFEAQVDKLNTGSPKSTDQSVTTQLNPNDTSYLYYLLKLYSPKIGYQMVASATNGAQNGYRLNQGLPGSPGPVLQKAVNIGLTYKPEFMEFWKVDAENSSLNGIIQNATNTMESN